MELGPHWAELGMPGLFLACFLAATILPFSSEAVLAIMTFGPWSAMALWSVASLGNWLGGMSSYGLGRLGSMEGIARWIRRIRHVAVGGLFVILFLALGCAPEEATAQTTFYRSYGVDPIDDAANCVLQLPDGGFLLLGYELPDDPIQIIRSNGVLLRTDEFGEQLWRMAYTGPEDQSIEFKHAILTRGGKLAVTGLCSGCVFPLTEDLLLCLLDLEGDLLWSAHVGGVNEEWGYQVREVPGGGFAVGGWQATPFISQSNHAMYLVRFDPVGDTLWTRTYADTAQFGSNVGFCLEVTPDSGFVLAGAREYAAPLVLRIDQAGDTLWRQELDTLYTGRAHDVICTDEGDILITGYGTVTGFSRPFLAKLDPNGALLWVQTYPEVFPGWALAMSETTFGYVLGGMTVTYDFRIMAVDLNGELLWSHTIEPEYSYGDGYDIIQTSDGGFALCGLHGSNGTANMVLIKTDQNGLVTSLGSEQNLMPSHPIQLFPNPAGLFVTASYTLARGGQTSVRLLNMEGQLVASLAPPASQGIGEHQVTLDLAGIRNGCYLLEITSEHETWTARLIKH